MTVKEELERAAPALDRVNEAIRDNPLAAGLIGAGLAWMLFGAKGFGVMGGLALGAGGKVVSAAKSAGRGGGRRRQRRVQSRLGRFGDREGRRC